MPASDSWRRATAAAAHGARAVAGPAVRSVRWLTGGLRRVRSRVSAGDTGLRRLLDLQAASIAGDTLIAVGLAGTIFFAVPLGEARGNVALYLLVTMVPFALLAPLIGPLLDLVPHGRRYALAATLLGRAMLAWLIADYLDTVALYPAAFGVLVLSRAYGVARAGTVPRLLPPTLGLSQVNARGSLYGTVAGALVTPVGLAAFWFGPQWPLRVAAVIFLVGMVIALRLPPRADTDPAEAPPRLVRALLRLRPRNGGRVLSRGLVSATVAGSASHRALYGFLLIFLVFAVREPGPFGTAFGPVALSEGAAIGLVSGALVVGTFLAVAVGSRLRLRRPAAVPAVGLVAAAASTTLAALRFTMPAVVLCCVVAAVSSGFAKLAADSSIQERVPERQRATAFAHSETLLMLAFVAGGGLGLVPVPGRLGLAVAAGLTAVAAGYAVVVAVRLRAERLRGPGAAPPERAAGAPVGRTVDPPDAPADDPDRHRATVRPSPAPRSHQ